MKRSEFREYLEAGREVALANAYVGNVVQLNRALRNKRVMNRLYKKARKAAQKRHGGSIADWLADGGWAKLFEWITFFIDLFSGKENR